MKKGNVKDKAYPRSALAKTMREAAMLVARFTKVIKRYDGLHVATRPFDQRFFMVNGLMSACDAGESAAGREAHSIRMQCIIAQRGSSRGRRECSFSAVPDTVSVCETRKTAEMMIGVACRHATEKRMEEFWG